jgi:two-component system response regulator AtoC
MEKYAHKGLVKKITATALSKLQKYSWPGNVRELENVAHSLAILTPGEIIEDRHLPNWALNGCGENGRKAATPVIPELSTAITYKDYLRRAERAYIEHILSACKNDRTMAATVMSLGRTTLYAKLKELGISNGN